MSGWRADPVSSPSSNDCSMVTRRSLGSISAASARSRVVLPEFIAPETTMFFLARTAAPSSDRRSGSIVPMAERSSSDRSAKRCRRIEIAGRAETAMSAESRAPPGSWRSSSGRAVSNRRSERPNRPAADRTRSTNSSSESATAGISRLVPSAKVAQTRSHPLTSIFSISGSSTSTWRRPRPNRASRTDWASSRSSVGVSSGAPESWSDCARASRCRNACWRANSRRSSPVSAAPSGPDRSSATRRRMFDASADVTCPPPAARPGPVPEHAPMS